MAVWICRDCTAAYSVGAPRCPECGSTDYADEEEQNMPKITVASGPSIAGISGAWGDDEPEQDAEGSEESSPGSSSSPSETSSGSDAETSSSGASKRARTTASRGGRARTDSSTARSTGTGQTARTSKTDSDED